MTEQVRCGLCGRSITCGQLMSWAHTETTPQGKTWHAHNARPATRSAPDDLARLGPARRDAPVPPGSPATGASLPAEASG